MPNLIRALRLNRQPTVKKRMTHRIKSYFITGLLVVTPIWATYLVLKTLLITLDGFLGNLIQRHLLEYYIPGVGTAALLLLILATGLLTQNILGRKVVEWWETLLHQVPFVRGVYATFKAIVDTFSIRSREKFNKVVLIEFPRKGQYSLAFVTGVAGGEVQRVTHQKVMSVYVPTTPNPTSGYLLMVPDQEIIPLEMSVEDGLKMIVSGGLFTPVDREAAGSAESGGAPKKGNEAPGPGEDAAR